jgi:hypothetical protein
MSRIYLDVNQYSTVVIKNKNKRGEEKFLFIGAKPPCVPKRWCVNTTFIKGFETLNYDKQHRKLNYKMFLFTPSWLVVSHPAGYLLLISAL